MQRPSRFLCSTASESSTSNITLRTYKRSGTFSAGDDREPESVDHASKTKAPSSKCNLRLLASNQKNLRKPAKSGRTQRPDFRSLRNTVVLAPFHSLKKCFQTKLVDLYSFEKTANHKTQVAKKKNMSFEYDIIEMNSSGSTVKKEGKAIKKIKKKSECANYCQCKKTALKAEEKMSMKNSKRGKKTSRRQAPRLPENLKTKKRKLSGDVISPITLKTELAPVLGGYEPNDRIIFSHGNLSPSAKSSQSKYDSWETYSNSPTCKEEHMEGSLAISTTSFDSYLEHFDKNNCGHSDFSRNSRKRGKSHKTVERIDTNFSPKPNANSSRYLVMHVETKNSDGQIMDFTGTEPPTQLISSSEHNQHLQTLQRQSKGKAKKPENELVAGYNLRSLSSSKEKIIQKKNQEPHEQRSDGNLSRYKAMQIEAGTQVERNTVERGSSASFLKKGQESTSNVFCKSLNTSLDKTAEEPPLSSTQKAESLPRTISNIKLLCENPHLSRIDPLESQVKDIESRRSEVGLNVSGEHSDRASRELMTGLSEQLQDPTHSQQSQGKETDFIFGPGNNAARLGESCEFSFGFNCVFSDDDED